MPHYENPPVPPKRRPILAPEELRRRQLAALTNWVMAGARAQPVVLTLEDLHWADPTTLDVLRGIAERGALAPLFVLLTARPEFRPSWGARSHHGAISLVPLDRYQVRHMVEELAARHALAKDVTKDSNALDYPGPPECTQCVPAGADYRFYKVGEDGHVFGLRGERSFDDDATAIARAAA